jgi:Glycosyl hydrolases family 38 N-terminal domain
VDPGWLRTFEDYFNQSTRFILDSAVNKLTQHRNMTFIWTEMAFFAKWWKQ